MRLVRQLLRRLRALTRRADVERDLDDEMRFHLEMEVEKHRREGLPPDAARRAALVSFGGVDRFKEEARDARGVRVLEELAQDTRYALRMMRKAPGYSLLVAMTLALGIGANTAIFSVVDAVLLRPLPYEDPDRLAIVYAQNPDRSAPRFSVSYADWLDWRRQNRVFTDIALFMGGTSQLGGGAAGEPERLQAIYVTDNFFPVLGARAAAGRLFLPGDAERDGDRAVVLTHGLWTRRFGASPTLVGQTIQLGGQSRLVAGILPREYTLFGDRGGDVYMILLPSMIPGVENHAQHMTQAIARLRPGVTLAQAQRDMEAVAARVAAEHPDVKGWSANVFGVLSEMTRTIDQPLLVLLAASVLVLFIACINIASLQLTRGGARARELAVRRALGATRRRLVVQLLVESGLLALIGGAAGLGVSVAATRALVRLVPNGSVPRLEEVAVNGRLLLFTLGTALVTGLLFGLWPALRAADPRLAPSLREGGRKGSAGNVQSARLRRALVVTEVALALVLVVGAGLVVQSFRRMLSVNPGFRPEQLATMRLSLPRGRYPDSVQFDFYRSLIDRLTANPAIRGAAAVNIPPFGGGGIVTNIRPIGQPPTTDGSKLMSPVVVVTPGYFKVMGIPLLRGRDVAWTDRNATLILSSSAARRLWPDADALGKRIAFGTRDTVGAEIVGIVADARTRERTGDPLPIIYMLSSGASSIVRTMTVIVQGNAPLPVMVGAARSTLRELDSTLPLYNIRSMEQVVDASVAQPRLNTTLLSIFAAVALLLATVGIYGVVSYSVSQRTHEMGLRMALGARASDVRGMVVREGALLAAIGIVLGLVASRLTTPVIASWLYGVSPGDPLTFAGVALLLVAIALAASWIPARRATRVDPVIAMREG